MPYLYRHIRLDKNEVFYVGIGSDNEYEYKRAYNRKDRNRYWKHIIKVTDYEVEIVIDDLTWEQACEKEKEFIKLYGRKDLKTGTLVNLTDGGDGMFNPAEEIREKIREGNKKNAGKNHPNYGKHRSEETKRKIGDKSKLRCGDKHYNYGKHLSEETKKKIADANRKRAGENHPLRGKPLSEEHKNKISEKKKGKKIGGMKKGHKMTPEQIEKHRQKLLGKKYTEEHRRKISERLNVDGVMPTKEVQQIDQKTNQVLNVFKSITEAAKITDSNRSKISACCKGKRKTTGGFKWKYLN